MPIATKSITKKKRINISNNEQKYQKLLAKHRSLKSEFKKYKERHERKVSLLRCQLKHTLKFVGVKLQNLETRLLWYQKQWKNQQSQMAKMSKFDKNVKNKCIQTKINSSMKKRKTNSNSSSKSNSKKSSKQCSTRSSISLPSKPKISTSTSIHNNQIIDGHKSVQSINTSKYNIVIPSQSIMPSVNSEDQITSPLINIEKNNENMNNINTDIIDDKLSSLPFLQNPIKDNIIMNDIYLKDKALSDLPQDAVAKHNQLITRLRARLDTMSDILTSTRDKLHSEFDHMSFPSSVDLDATDDSLQFRLDPQFKHLNLKQVFDGSVEVKLNENNQDTNAPQIASDLIGTLSIDEQNEMLSVSAIQVTNNDKDIVENQNDSIGILSDDNIDFQSVVSRVTEKMTLLGDKLKNRTSSVSYPCSDVED